MTGADRARHYLQIQQREAAGGLLAGPMKDTYARALQSAQEYEAHATMDDGKLRIGPFRYSPDTEHARWDRTREIINRVAPGPYEDAGYFSMLAREAATLELLLSGPDMQPSVSDTTRRVLFGTTGQTGSHASAGRVGTHAVIMMSAGMMYFLYQAAKSVVLSWQQTKAPAGSLTSFSSKLDDTRKVLARDSTAADWLTALLSSWFFDGVAMPPHSALPAEHYVPSLSVLVQCAERFVLAHEYAHVLADIMPPADLNVATAPHPWAKELRADAWGMSMVVESAATYDHFAPNMALQGPVLTMKAHEIVDRALALVHPVAVSATHPPFPRRLESMLAAYQELPGIADDPRLAAAPALAVAETLELLWEQIAPRLKQQLRSGQRLHPIWNRSIHKETTR